MRYFFLIFLKLFDYFNQKKIINFLKSKSLINFDVFFDVGAHKGETIGIYLKNFNIKKIYSIEPSSINFNSLKKKIPYFIKRYPNTKIEIENFALGSEQKKIYIKHMDESSSSTIRELNISSNYFKRKSQLLYSGKSKDFFKKLEVNQLKLKNYMETMSIKKIDFIKIDTEGYEFEVLLGAEEEIKNINLIIFEHHYHDMIKKNYNFSDIHNLLKNKNFKQIYKSKMPFRKTFEYIYVNNLNIKL